MTEAEPTMALPILGDLPWAGLFQRRCRARTKHQWADRAHCDLRRGHAGPHVAERGLGADIVWGQG